MTTDVLKARELPIAKLRPADWNANRVSKSLLAKIRKSIETFGFVENLVARPHPDEDGAFEVLSGNHRLQILQELGETTVSVVVIDVDDAHAKILAQAMNRTRGRDDPLAYRQLMNDLLAAMPAEDIAALLPQNERSLGALLGQFPEEKAVDVSEMFGVIVECKDQAEQDDLIDRFESDGRECRPLMVGGGE